MPGIESKRAIITLDTHLKDIPRAWLEMIEPRLTRPKGSLCWEWTGAVDDRGEPIMSVPKLGGGRTTVRLKRMIADLFWKVARHHDIIHECGNMRCLNPSHFRISHAHYSQENRDKLISSRKRNIKDYLARKEPKN